MFKKAFLQGWTDEEAAEAERAREEYEEYVAHWADL